MRAPYDSLDDFKGNFARKRPDPPAAVELEFTGEIEVLKPLARWEGPLPSGVATGETFLGRALNQLSWFHRSLAMAGALTVFTFLLGTGIYLAIYGPPTEPIELGDLAINQPSDDILSTADGPDTSAFLLDDGFPSTFDGFSDVRPAARPRRVRPRVQRAAYRPRPLPVPQFVVSQFVPTTLIIFIENGEIKTRVEPQAAYKRPLTLPN